MSVKAGFHMIADRRSQIAIRSAIVCDPAIVIAEDRTMFYRKAGFHMIADRRSQIADRNKVCDCDLRSAIIWKPALSFATNYIQIDALELALM